MDVELAPLEDESSPNDSIPLGTFTDGLIPRAPAEGEFIYRVEETLHTIKPAYEALHPPEVPGISPPLGRYFPTPPVGGYTLLKTQAYTRGFAYVADYDLRTMEIHKNHLIHISTPPLTLLNGQVVVPGMIRMEPGIPFVFRFNREAHRLHTVGCLQTLESLKHYPDYPQILDASVQLAKLSWGYSSDDGSTSVPPIYELDGLKCNDRSTTRPFKDDSRDGSYSLGHTVMKGDGLGTVLPSVQANSSQAVSQISAVLKTLHTLRRLVMPKCLSRFEHDIWDFHMDFNNVFSFGGLEPNGSSVQLNVSSLGVNLNKAIGDVQGFWHADFLDDPQFWTLFIMLLRIGPDGDPGPFFLARGGIYVHELGAWIVFLVFKGTDLHTGSAPHENAQSHAAWVRSVIDSIWNLVGPQNRLGFVIYLGSGPSKRLGSMNVTPPTGFGNYGSSVAHKATQKDFASHGHVTMGSRDDQANRLGREAISDFYNTLRHCHLSLNIDVDKLMGAISYRDQDGVDISLRPLPYHPIQDREHIKKHLALYAWHSSESDLFNLGITNKMLRLAGPTQADSFEPLALLQDAVELVPEPGCVSLPVQEVLSKHSAAGQTMLMIRLHNDNKVYNISQDHPCVLQNELIQAWIMQQLDTNHLQIPGTLPNRIAVASARLLAARSTTLASTSDNSLASGTAAQYVGQTTTPTQVDTVGLTMSPPESADPEISRPQRNTRKRKYDAGDDSDEDSTSSVTDDDSDYAPEDDEQLLAKTRGDDDVYEVEDIIGHNFDDITHRQWLVKFKGYATPEYVYENDLSGSLRLLSRYNRKNGLENLHLARSVVAKIPRKDIVSRRGNAVTELAANYMQLRRLLDEHRLDSEITGMVQRFQGAINGGKDYWSTDTSISSLAALWTEHCNTTHDLHACLPFFDSSPIDTAIIKFNLMQKSMSVLPRFNASLHQLDIVERGFQQELCRALVAIYDWYSTTGPLLAQLLLSCHRTAGFEGVKKKSPSLAQLVDHVVQYAHSCVVAMRKKHFEKPRTRSRLGKKNEIMVAFNNFPQSHFHQNIPAESLNQLPGNLYGLLESQKSRKSVKLPPVAQGRLPIANDPLTAVFTASANCLEEIWSREIVLPAIGSLEFHSTFNPRSSKSNDLHILRDRAITRGAILSCLQQACQSDGIFASAEMKTFLSRPTQDLFPRDGKHSRHAEKIQGPGRDEYLRPLREAIEERLDRFPAIVEKAAQLGDLMETHLFAVHSGGVVDYDNFLPAVDDDPDLNSTSVTRRTKTDRQLFSTKDWAVPPAAKNALLRQVLPTLFLTPLALILREALNKKRNLGTANETMGRILNGSHPNQSSSRVFPPTHTDPIRQFSEYASLFQKHLPGQRLTSRSGISSLLSWMGTGQGYGTKEFLARISRADGFFSSTLDEQLEIFRPIISNNRNLSFQLGSDTDGVKMHLIPGYIACFDERIWGQPNNLFNICPVIRSRARISKSPSGQKPRLTIEEKFALYWSQSTQDKWAEFLGAMIDQDPATWDGRKPSWFSVMDFLQNLDIPLFGRGLTVLQTANNLVFANIATMPTQAEVASWIFKHKSLGAHRGLQILGFSYIDSHAAVKFAFTVIYNHLDQFLTDSDKRILGFNPLFLEHILCKVARWSSRLHSSKAHGDVPSFHALSTQLEGHLPPWISGDNEGNRLAIPFPLTVSETQMIALRDSV